MKLINNRWVDDNNNSWSTTLETEESAMAKSKTLVNCRHCRDCSDCSGCSGCSDCSDCSGCSGCRGCSYCSGCRHCRGCRGCSDYKQNPERITSPLIGSRKSSTTVYWVNDNIQVVCGCFKGDLQKFKDAVQKTHGNNEHGIAYNNFIAKVENYINTQTFTP